jgi:Ca2+-binding EF-hand superfamily protein
MKNIRDELVILLRHLGVNLEDEELDLVMADLNANGTGEITFDEFYACKPIFITSAINNMYGDCYMFDSYCC